MNRSAFATWKSWTAMISVLCLVTTPELGITIGGPAGILPSRMGAHDPLDAFVQEFDCSPFSTDCSDVDQVSQGLPCASINHYQCCLLALEEVWKKGYRRPALLIYTSDYLQNWRWRESAYHFFIFQRQLQLIPPLILTEWSDQEVSVWLKKHRPDVLLAPFPHTPQLLRGLGFQVPKDFAFCALQLLVPGKSDIAGIDEQDSIKLGSVVDLVIDQMNRNVRGGRQETPVHLFTTGKWVDGATLPGKPVRGGQKKTPAKRGGKKSLRR